MVNRVITFLFCSIFALLFLSCSDDPVSLQDNGEGRLSLNLDKENCPENVAALNIELTREGYNPIIDRINLSDSSDEFLVDEIPAGLWLLNVNAVNDADVILYTGSVYVEVIASEVSYLSLTLSPVNTDTTGGVIIKIIWSEKSWTDYMANPIFTYVKSPLSPIGVSTPKIIYDQGKYKVWYTNIYNSAATDIGYAESSNAVVWDNYSVQPVLSRGSYGAWDSHSVQTGAVIKVDSAYRMYYTGYSNEYDNWHIGMAVSNDGINWTKLPSPVLYGTSAEYQLHVDDVIKIGAKYYMYYTIRNPYSTVFYSIGMAVSNDGYTWTRYAGNPILTGNSSWENNGVYFPSVIKENNYYKMAYMNATASGFGFALSADGITWEKSGSNPFFTTSDCHNYWATTIAYPFIRKFNNKYHLYYTGTYYNNNAIGLATK
jgi:predicted GH43/DUF377 family glycosyl hydrolase